MPNELTCPACGQDITVGELKSDLVCENCGQRIGLQSLSGEFNLRDEQEMAPVKTVSAMTIIAGFVAASVILLCCGGLGSLFVYREVQSARLNRCISNSKVLSLAFHNHHHVYQRLPLASSEPVTGTPAKGQLPHPAGYSWITALLPYLEEQELRFELDSQSDRLRIPPFDPRMIPPSKKFFGCYEMQMLHCPSSRAGMHVDTKHSDYQEYPAPRGEQAPASASYIALSATHRLNFHGLSELADPNPDDHTEGNGTLVFPTQTGQNLHHGLPLSALTDGTSQTVIMCESREEAYSAWIDGQVTWGVGAWPQNISVPGRKHSGDGLLGWPPTDMNSLISMAAAQEETHIYLQASQFGGTYGRKAGPSSDHREGLVVHAFADGHVLSISPEIDRNVYLRLITRSGGEPNLYGVFK